MALKAITFDVFFFKPYRKKAPTWNKVMTQTMPALLQENDFGN
jgi:hypothetical protein